MAAVLLARAGLTLTLVEQHRFPRDKVCGECLSSLAIDTLHRIGLTGGLRSLRPAMLRSTTIHSAAGKSFDLPLPRPMWGLSRSAFDSYLLTAAQRSGATVLQPARCEGIETKPARVRVRDLRTNDVRTLEADRILVADGKGSLTGATPPPTGDFGIKAHFEDVDGPTDRIELFGCDGLYGGLAAVEGGRWNAAFSVPAARLRKHAGDVQSLFEGIALENPTLGRRMRGARRMGNWLAAPLPRFAVREHWPEGVIPVGNAAAAVEPIGGEGMGLAIRSAELAAEHLLNGRDMSELFAEYRRLWTVRRTACRAAALAVSSPGAARCLLPLLNVIPPSRGLSLALLGKHHFKPSMSDIP